MIEGWKGPIDLEKDWNGLEFSVSSKVERHVTPPRSARRTSNPEPRSPNPTLPSFHPSTPPTQRGGVLHSQNFFL